MSNSWTTKWGARRVRHDPPTLAEALAAAQGFTDDRGEQARIAADLMGVPVADAETEMRRTVPRRRATETMMAPGREKGGARLVIIERKTSRRLQPPAAHAKASSRPL